MSWVPKYFVTFARLARSVGGVYQRTRMARTKRGADPGVTRRKAAARGRAEALEARTPEVALARSTLAFEKQVEDRWRK